MKHATHGPKAVDEAVVERAPGERQDAERVPAAVIPRLRQQELLAELGVLALKGTPFQELLDHTARLTAEGLQAEFCKVMEHLPAENRLLVRAGVGWEPGIVGTATIGADLDSPGGFALRTGKPVISNHLENEERFRTPELLLEHGIRRAMNVILQGDGTPFGVLEVDSRSEGEFGEHDIAFLQGAANLLGMAIERQRIERNLRAAIGERDILLQEMSHRIKNSLQLVASMLHLQSGGTQDEAVRHQLAAASSRVAAVARAHHRLYQSSDIRTLDLSAYLRDLCADLDASVAHCRIEVEAPERVEAATDRAVPIALVVNELVANAAKYAYPEGSPCRVRVRLARADEPASICLSVQDDGVGLPAGFDANAGRGLGMRIVTAFAQQLGADLRIRGRRPGTEFMLVLPTSALGTSPRA